MCGGAVGDGSDSIRGAAGMNGGGEAHSPDPREGRRGTGGRAERVGRLERDSPQDSCRGAGEGKGREEEAGSCQGRGRE